MRILTSISFLLLLYFGFTNSSLAQSAEGNVFIVTNMERAFPEEGSARELDSLSALYMDKVFCADNEFVISAKTIRHWWGHNNRDFIQIVEVKSWDDVTKANQKSVELFEKAWATKEARDAFNKAYDKYFTGQHSDEIYSQVVAPK
jgi:hypothetical protein